MNYINKEDKYYQKKYNNVNKESQIHEQYYIELYVYILCNVYDKNCVVISLNLTSF